MDKHREISLVSEKNAYSGHVYCTEDKKSILLRGVVVVIQYIFGWDF